MKDILKFSLGICIVAACNNNTPNHQTNKATTVITNNDSINSVVTAFINKYYTLKDNFIAENDTAINNATMQLITANAAMAIKVNNDSTLSKLSNINTLTASISAELKGLLGENNINSKRKSFQMLSNIVYDYLKLIQYKQQPIYQQFCPMAFDNEGASWLSNTTQIQNPYLPKTMLTCGEVTDTLAK
jgi:hypothetical protein